MPYCGDLCYKGGMKHLSSQSGNALIYVLIVVALFAALNFVLSRQTDTTETGILSQEKTEILAGQILSTSSQIKQAVDMMLYSGSGIDELTFTTPDDEPAFSTGSSIHKLFHPDGGAAILPAIPAEAVAQASADPVAKWYIGRFNNVEWTESGADDVILVAHQLGKTICESINEKLTGSTTIPALTAGKTLANLMIDDAFHTGTNEDFDAADCAGCNGWPQLCVSDSGVTMYSYYSIVAQN